jgi:hypothetical protein
VLVQNSKTAITSLAYLPALQYKRDPFGFARVRLLDKFYVAYQSLWNDVLYRRSAPGSLAENAGPQRDRLICHSRGGKTGIRATKHSVFEALLSLALLFALDRLLEVGD